MQFGITHLILTNWCIQNRQSKTTGNQLAQLDVFFCDLARVQSAIFSDASKICYAQRMYAATAPVSISPERNERDQYPTRMLQNQQSRPLFCRS